MAVNECSPVVPHQTPSPTALTTQLKDSTPTSASTRLSLPRYPPPIPSPSSSDAKRPLELEYDSDREVLLSQVLELQDSLKDLVLRVETARNNHAQMLAENQILLKYVNNLMSATGSDPPPNASGRK
ncbi:hypothetical protein SeMB42_g07543 [Synchytrium endobioticum]|uniref:Short coiled-coil protein n=1 Tax=Synchytrium endobioticum TaxID=286115 RepID=A0A507BVR2_9FUNG|nr:hypothetical protein SeMB42_g07543 [Synchytrium endobioticum]